MESEELEPQSLIAVTNWRSRVCIPSEVYTDEFKEWAHHVGAYLYLVLVGPRIEIHDLVQEDDGWKVRTVFHDGEAMKPRTIPVPFDVIPRETAELVAGTIMLSDSRRLNAAEVTRLVLSHAQKNGEGLTDWHRHTIQKFFTYRVEYIGQAYGKHGERTAAERISQGHKTAQQVLAETMDHHPNSAVGFIVMDAGIQGRELSGSIGPDNVEEMKRLLAQFLDQPEGPLVDKAKLITVAEAMLIRFFPEAKNIEYKEFPKKDAPALVRELRKSGISHVGVHMDVRQSMALIQHPDPDKRPGRELRFGVNLSTGEPETLQTSAPSAWRVE